MKLESIKVGDVFSTFTKLVKALGEIPSKGGTNVEIQKKEILRYLNFEKTGKISRGKVTNEIVITEIYDTSKDKVDNRVNNGMKVGQYRKDFENYLCSQYEDNMIGVYCIASNENIYVGSTLAGFRKRFMQHKQGYQENTKELLELEEGLFQSIYTTNIEDEYIIREIEQMYIDYFENSNEFNLVNVRELTYCTREINIRKLLKNNKKNKH